MMMLNNVSASLSARDLTTQVVGVENERSEMSQNNDNAFTSQGPRVESIALLAPTMTSLIKQLDWI